MELIKFLVEEFKKASTIMKGVIIGIILLIIAVIMANVHADKEEQERLKKEAEAAAQAAALRGQTQEVDIDAELQKAYTEVWGEAPEGFKWQADGSLIAISDNATTAEDTAWYFLRGLTILDFSTAEKYNFSSTVITTYDDYYSTEQSLNYYTQFLRKMYKQCLTSIEINKIVDSAVFADGDRIVTFSINALDLTDKDFWMKDADEIFAKLNNYYNTESDSTKASQYLYDYVLNYYSSGEAKKRTVQVDLRLEKQPNGGWLVSDDMDLHMLCSYEYGVNVTEYIMKAYEAWVLDQYSTGNFVEEPDAVDATTGTSDSTSSRFDENSQDTTAPQPTEGASTDVITPSDTGTSSSDTIDFSTATEEEIKRALDTSTETGNYNTAGSNENAIEH